jgi:fucose 4-O-acetylase-like acetyltransferase
VETLLSRILITLGSAASIGFGVWHFFVPVLWNWYSYIDASATELVLAIRAINVFFSLCLVLFGLMNLLLAYGPDKSRYATVVVLGATCSLWSARVVMQIVYPQGSLSAILQYGMLLAFALVLACHAVSLVLVIRDRSPR